MAKRIAIIPARGGSERLPGKNILPFFGYSLIYWTIRSAIESAIFDYVVVSTDCPEIATVSKKAGAEVPFLRTAHHDNYAPVSAATTSALIQSEEYFGLTYDTVVQLLPTCPLRSAETIVNAVQNFEASIYDSQISVVQSSLSHLEWAIEFSEAGRPRFRNPASLKQRSQNLPTLYLPTGAVWVSTARALREYQTFYSKDWDAFEVDWIDGIDIDDEVTLTLAKALYLYRASNPT